MSAIKYETLSLRLTQADADLIRSYAEKERVSVSALIRSTMVRLINNELQFSFSEPVSPAPNFDKLSFDARELLLRPFDFSVAAFIKQGLTVQQSENLLLIANSLVSLDVLQSQISPGELKGKMTAFYQNQVKELESALVDIE